MKKTLLILALSISSFINAQTWVTQSTGFTTVSRGVNQIKIVDANTVWGLAYDGSGGGANVQEFTKTTDGGTIWTPGVINVGNTTLNIINISPVSATTAWVSAVDGTNGLGVIYKTVDGGLTWVQQNATGYTTAGSSWLNGVHFFDANNGISIGDPAPGSKFEIYKTTDGGANWALIAGLPNPNAASGEWGYGNMMAAAGNSFWFGTNKGKIYRTTDMGTTWSKLNGPTGLTDFGSAAINGNIYFSDNNNGAILGTIDSGTTYKLYTTSNGGTTWTAGTAYTGGYNRILSYVPGSTTIVATGANATPPSAAGSAYSTNNGATWTQIDTGTQRGSVSFFNGTTGWCGGFNTNATTGGIFKYSGPALSVADYNNTSEFSVYPNPTTGNIKLSSAANKINNVIIYNIIGKEVYNNTFSNLSTETNIDISALESGIYFLKAVSENNEIQIIKISKN